MRMRGGLSQGLFGRARRGQSLVEFALVLPLLAVLLFAIIQYGLIFNAYMTLRHGAHVTARTLSLAGASTNNVQATACDAVQPVLDCARLASPVVSSATIGGKPA